MVNHRGIKYLKHKPIYELTNINTQFFFMPIQPFFKFLYLCYISHLVIMLASIGQNPIKNNNYSYLYM